jgi:predicted metalloprotease with PDZ domain
VTAMRKLILATLLCCMLAGAQDTIRINLDATDAPRRLFHVRMAIPAKPGAMTLLYPEWIPGEHGPTGPITDLAGLKITANGQTIPWKRDSVNLYAFHLAVPAGAAAIDVAFDFISPPDTSGFSSGASATTELAVLNWNQFLLYPQGASPDQLRYQASLKVPNAWRYGTALPIARESGQEIEFQPAPLTTLIDSPVSAGSHYRTIQLGNDGSIAHYLHLAADSDRALEIMPDELEHYKNLVTQTGLLFGSRHYRSYHFLLTLSDHVASFGLEHHESSDDRVAERSLIDESLRKISASLLPHEFVHSWNGKYRRPAGLVTADYSQPMKGDLLWIYEGLTNYLGEILTPRSGLFTKDEFRDALARVAAELDQKSGRTWRPLADTAVAAQRLYGARDDYADLRRGVDFYDEGTLIWLEADVLIRQLSGGAKSLDDFCKLFHGGPGGAPALKSYTFEDVVTALNAVQPNDWAEFLRTRVEATQPRAPLGGIENSGWKLVYDGTRSDVWKAFEDEHHGADLAYSLGLYIKDDGTVSDVSLGRPAQKAGIAPDMKVIAVNNRRFNLTILREAIQHATAAPEPIELLVRSGEYYSVHKVDYHGGEKYPHLERDSAKPDILSQIIEPLRSFH